MGKQKVKGTVKQKETMKTITNNTANDNDDGTGAKEND